MFESAPVFKNMMSKIINSRKNEDQLTESELMELEVQKRNFAGGMKQNASSDPLDFSSHPLMQKLSAVRSLSETFGIEDPYFRLHEHVQGTRATVKGIECINYSVYNYLGFNDHPFLRNKVAEAVQTYGTSVGASRLVAGERSFQLDLERRLAKLYDKDAAVVFVSGHATNVSTISTLFGSDDLIVYDGLSHNSIIEGIRLSRASFFPYAHNDLELLETILINQRDKFHRALIVTEGLFSMDGDIPDLDKLIEIKNKYSCFLMIDEAHALGVLGATGKGLHEYYAEKSMAVCQNEQYEIPKKNDSSGNAEKEHYDVDYLQKKREKMSYYANEVDLWMGTLSKTLASCGGYIAADCRIIDILKFGAPGFVYSVGLSAPMAVAASTALELMEKSSERVNRLQHNARFFISKLKEHGLCTGRSAGYAVVPVIIGSSHKAVNISNALYEKGIDVLPIIHPAVEEQQARLRFFITSEHTEQDLGRTADLLAEIAEKENIL